MSENTQRILEKAAFATHENADVQKGDRVTIRGTKKMGEVIDVARDALRSYCHVAFDKEGIGAQWIPTQSVVVSNYVVPGDTPGFQKVAFDVYQDYRKGPDYGSIWKKENIDGEDYLVVYTDDDGGMILRSIEAALETEAQNWPRGGEGGETYNDSIEPMGWEAHRTDEEERPRAEQSEEVREEGEDELTQAIEDALNESDTIDPWEPTEGGDDLDGGGIVLRPEHIESLQVKLKGPEGERAEYELTPTLPEEGVAPEGEAAPMSPGGEQATEELSAPAIEF